MISGPQARELGLKIVFDHPAGIGPTDIGKKILELHPDMKDDKGRPSGTIRGAVWDLDRKFPDKVQKTGSGFVPVGSANRIETSVDSPANGSNSPNRRARSPKTGARPLLPTNATPVWNASEAQQKIAALEDAVSQARAEIDRRDERINNLEGVVEKATSEAAELRNSLANIRSEIDDAKTQIASPMGVLTEAQNASVLVDIRQAVLAGSDEGTLEAVQRIVADLAKTRTQLALTGIRPDGARLKAARKLAGVDQMTLGLKLGYAGRHTIDDIERGKYALAKHPKVAMWVDKIEAKHASS